MKTEFGVELDRKIGSRGDVKEIIRKKKWKEEQGKNG